MRIFLQFIFYARTLLGLRLQEIWLGPLLMIYHSFLRDFAIRLKLLLLQLINQIVLLMSIAFWLVLQKLIKNNVLVYHCWAIVLGNILLAESSFIRCLILVLLGSCFLCWVSLHYLRRGLLNSVILWWCDIAFHYNRSIVIILITFNPWKDYKTSLLFRVD